MMNAYRERQLGYQAEVGAAAIKEYCKERDCKCHIDGLPDCPFAGSHDNNYAYHFCMLESIPIHWDVK